MFFLDETGNELWRTGLVDGHVLCICSRLLSAFCLRGENPGRGSDKKVALFVSAPQPQKVF